MSGITKVSVTGTGQGKYQQKMQAGPHIVTADEPRSLGGDGTGATPVSLLLGALGSCTAITVRMYIDRKEWPLEGMEIFLTHEKQGDRDHISREIIIHGPQLTTEQRQRILEIADKCPVHKMLSGSADVTTRERTGD